MSNPPPLACPRYDPHAMGDPLLRSALLPVPHGFSTRAGGVSDGPYAQLNLGHGVGDEAARVDQNLCRIAQWAGIEPAALYTVDQVHGAAVVEAPLATRVQADA